MKNRTSASAGKKPSLQRTSTRIGTLSASVYPFSAIVAQDEMKLAMILNVIDPRIGGVLIMGHRGTGKSTAVRALGDLLPEISYASGCAYRCDPADEKNWCDECREALGAGTKLSLERCAVRVVDLPLGATEDRVCGTIDIEQAIRSGIKRFEPGLLARANRGFLYIDEVNLLDDHLVDLLLDVSVTGINNVEREGISIKHPARFVLIGSGNPEEGELRPQLLDRFGLFVEVKTENDLDRRMEIVDRREAFDRDSEAFCAGCAESQEQLRRQILRGQRTFANVKIDARLRRNIARLCTELKIDGHRGELTITRASRALAAFEGRRKVSETDVRRVSVMGLRHRLRRDALEETGSAERIEQTLNGILGEGSDARSGRDDENGDGPPANGRRARDEVTANLRSRSKGVSDGQNGIPTRDLDAGTKRNVGADSPPKPMSHSSPGRKLKLGLDMFQTSAAGKPKSRPQSSRGIETCRSIYNQERGRYVRSVNSLKLPGKIAVDATLRATAMLVTEVTGQQEASNSGSGNWNPIPTDALRFKLFKRKQGRLFIFAIDLSGSMALDRINYARDAMFGLLRQSYIQRDSVAIVGFRGTAAEVMLPPSKSILRARRVLDSLPMGGGTPLSAALVSSLELAKRVGPKAGEIVLLIFTDGGANVPLHMAEIKDRAKRRELIEDEVRLLGSLIRSAGIEAVVVETQNTFRPSINAWTLSETLGARHVHVKTSRDATT